MGDIQELRGLFGRRGQAVAEHRVAEWTGHRDDVGPGGGQLLRSFVIDSRSLFFAEKCQAAAGSAAETALAVAGGFDETSGLGGDFARGFVTVLITA